MGRDGKVPISVALAAFALIVCGCAGEPSVAAAAPRAADGDLIGECDAAAVQHLVGRGVGKAPNSLLKQLSGASEIRLIRPGQPITMDYSTGRLNIEIDTENRITRLYCG